jgi:hypothetical protein
MTPVSYVLRDSAGTVLRGALDGAAPVLSIPQASQVSLELSAPDVAGYARDGADLVMTLADGRQIRPQGFFEGHTGVESRLHLSEDGLLDAVALSPGAGDRLVATYECAATRGKWSPDDALIFAPAAEVADVAVGRGLGAGLIGMVPGALGPDDRVTAPGAQATGESRVIEGNVHEVCAMGAEGARLVIDEDIQVIV